MVIFERNDEAIEHGYRRTIRRIDRISIGDKQQLRWADCPDTTTADRDTTSPLLINGGKVSMLTQSGSLTLEQGSLIDVSAGARQMGDGTLVAGKGGSISLATRPVTPDEDTPLTLGAELRAFSLTSGGSLSITTGSVCIADAKCETTDEKALLLKPSDTFKGGFGSRRRS